MVINGVAQYLYLKLKFYSIIFIIRLNLRGGKPMDIKRSQPLGIELVKRGIVTEADIDKALD